MIGRSRVCQRLCLAAVAGLLVMILGACSSGNGKGNTTLLQMLGRVPDTPELRKMVFFSDMDGIKRGFGQTGASLYQKWYVEGSAPVSGPLDTKEGLFADLIAGGGAGFIRPDGGVPLYDTLGYSYLDVSRGVLAGAPAVLGIVEGIPNPARVTHSLEVLKYDTASYEGATYYTRYADNALNLGDPLSRLVMANMNRVAVHDRLLVHARSTAQLATALDTLNGTRNSLADNPRYRDLALAMGDVVSGAIYTPTFGSRGELLDRWGLDSGPASNAKVALPPFLGDEIPLPSLVGTGIRLQQQRRVMVLALHYESESDAMRARDAIVQRAAKIGPIFDARLMLSAQWTVSESRIVRGETSSLVLIDLEIKTGVTSRVWASMLNNGDLDLLVS